MAMALMDGWQLVSGLARTIEQWWLRSSKDQFQTKHLRKFEVFIYCRPSNLLILGGCQPHGVYELFTQGMVRNAIILMYTDTHIHLER